MIFQWLNHATRNQGDVPHKEHTGQRISFNRPVPFISEILSLWTLCQTFARQQLGMWMYEMHNEVNGMLGKDTFGCNKIRK